MFDINQCYDVFATNPNEAYFWSGLGRGGQDIAADIASNNGGTTLEMLMDSNKNELIKAGFDYDSDTGRFMFSPENIDDWRAISKAYAEQASGDVHAVLGDKVKDTSVWNTQELPALKENNNVNSVIAVDPTTGKAKSVIYQNPCGESAGASETSGARESAQDKSRSLIDMHSSNSPPVESQNKFGKAPDDPAPETKPSVQTNNFGASPAEQSAVPHQHSQGGTSGQPEVNKFGAVEQNLDVGGKQKPVDASAKEPPAVAPGAEDTAKKATGLGV